MYVIFPVEEVLHSAAALSPATSTPQGSSNSTAAGGAGLRRPVSFTPNAPFTLYNHHKSYPVSPHTPPAPPSWLSRQSQTLDHRARRSTGTRSPVPAHRTGYTSAPVTPNQEQRTWLQSLALLRKSPSAVNFSTTPPGGGSSSPSGGRVSPSAAFLSASGGSRNFAGVGSHNKPGGVRGTKWLSLNCRSCNDEPSTGSSMGEPGLKDVVHPSHSEPLKVHSAVTLKLLKTVAEFTQQLSQIQEQHADQLQQLVETFRKRNAELRKERPGGPSTLFQCWETFLQEVEVDSAVAGEVATALGRQVGRPLLEGTFHRKLQARKCFLQREALENQLDKAGDQLKQTYNNYEAAYQAHLSSPNTMTLASYLEAHNEYVQQLRATNAMTESYYTTVLPQLLQELEDIYTDLSRIIADSIGQATDIVANRAGERSKRYEALTLQCRNVAPSADIAALVRGLGSLGPSPFQKTPFTAPRPPAHLDNHTQALAPTLKDEMVFERLAGLSLRSRHETLRREMADSDAQIRQLQDALDTLLRIQQRSLDANVYNKANELQEDICAKRTEMRQAMLNLAATRAQKELFSARTDLVPELKDKDRERKATSSTAAAGTSMKTKWMKALKGLRSNTSNTPGISSSERGGNVSSGSTASTSGGTSGSRDSDKDKGSRLYQTVISVMANRKKERGDLPTVVLDSIHVFQEYTYKKITPCDACSQILRGHSRQGLKCRFCKQNVHVDCQDRLGKCLAKSKLLRRQKSTPEIEAKTVGSPEEEQEMDQIYAVLKQAGELGGKKSVPGSLEKDMEGQGLQQPPIPPSTGRSGLGEAPMSSSSSLRKGGGSSGRIQGSQHSLAVQSTAAFHASSSEGYGLASSTPSCVGHLGSPRMQNLKLGPMKSLSADWEDTHSRAALVSVQPYSFRSHPHTPHSPRRHKLNLRMKSFSLDSPESSDLAQRQRCHPSTSAHVVTSSSSINAVATATGGSATSASGHGSTAYCQSPSSPVHNRRLLSARNMRMNSVELPDDNEKSLSSASNSPCPSPKPHRLLPTNLYVVLFNFKARQPDELDLKAGYKVTVVDTSDPDWWQGKCLGRTGYFPSQYVTKLIPGERPLQMTHNIQLTSDAEPAGLKLLRDQIVIQVSEETDGSVMVRTGDNKQVLCPLQYLQEV